ncbi:GNAT family N-acetyltransferase [Roseospira marina]|uniref:GNAT family N-acetyltransferase n=1 Tax=Roseospira marina TaxID=140057 RepID=A0A5M6IFD5_9PROT|nr:GNAT family N-acetyltransferase [Roseospira marina]KAA5606990.1 GNAT family N-acetyltransferase [Roseospira marina]MBB4312828.1 GNAT superfamily N-acetyltransferase [Roseospira marina]MBB5086399.1 GNAT superfamily N-acetyltransferase [Roseospira marina]
MIDVLSPQPALSLTLDEAQRRPIPPGRLREVVTDMECRTAPTDPPPPLPVGVRLVRHAGDLTWDVFGPIFHAVGAPWMWRDRLHRTPEAEAAHLADPGVVIHLLARVTDGAILGFCEMDCRDPAAGFKVLYFGLMPDVIGGGLGRALFAHALADAWTQRPSRIALDTCTHDSPRAVGFYEKFGFQVVGSPRVTEFDDPRRTGLLPPSAGADIPWAPLTERPPALRTNAETPAPETSAAETSAP